MKLSSAIARSFAEFLISFRAIEQRENAFGNRIGRFLPGDNACLLVQRRIDQTVHRINDGRSSQGISLEDIQAPTLTN